MSTGWYKRQRSIPERPWFKDAKVLQLFDFLEAMAYVADGRYEDKIIRRGSLPTTRPDMMEATGLSYKEVDRCLRKLISYGEIIVKGYCRYSLVTICNYDSYNTPLSLFGTTEGTTEGTAQGTTEGTTEGTAHISTIEERYKEDNNMLISPYSPYKKERETRDIALEIKKRYNKTFDGKLPPLIRLHEPTRRMVNTCLERFGAGSVDLVFQQILSEPFSLGQNKTGFIANFQYIFTPANYQQYLERAVLRGRQTTLTARTSADTWLQCLADLRKAVPAATAADTFDQLSFLSFDEKSDTLLLSVPSREAYAQIESTLSPTMAAVLHRHYGKNVTVNYQLSPYAASPVQPQTKK